MSSPLEPSRADESAPRQAPPLEAVDSELIAAAARGDREAFSQLVLRHQRIVYGYLRARTLHSHDAEDMTQEVFLRCYQSLSRFDASCDVIPWLLGIARNSLREFVRRVRRKREVAWTAMCLELDDAAPRCDGVMGEMTDELPTCLDALGASARQAIEMRYDARLRLAEIGEKLRRSEGAAKLLMFRARQALKSCLDRKTARNDA